MGWLYFWVIDLKLGIRDIYKRSLEIENIKVNRMPFCLLIIVALGCLGNSENKRLWLMSRYSVLWLYRRIYFWWWLGWSNDLESKTLWDFFVCVITCCIVFNVWPRDTRRLGTPDEIQIILRTPFSSGSRWDRRKCIWRWHHGAPCQVLGSYQRNLEWRQNMENARMLWAKC